MSKQFLPAREFQAYQVFGANTKVGKTVVITGLCRAANVIANVCSRECFYLKPIQTGYPRHLDESHVREYNPFTLLRTCTIYTYGDDVSPHIATQNPPKDESVLLEVKKRMMISAEKKNKNGSFCFLETVGAVHTPVMSGTPQVDFYRPLRLPTILVGDCGSGGISATLSSFESVYIRGYDIEAVFVFGSPESYALLERRVKEFGITFIALPIPPVKLSNQKLNRESMHRYYNILEEYMVPVLEKLNQRHLERFDKLETMGKASCEILWWPFTQHELVQDVTVIDSAYNDYFITYEKKVDGNMVPKEVFDSIASWWTQGLGHANPDLTLAAAHASGRYGHVIFPETTNELALSLAEKVLDKDQWASRVYFSDNGTTAVEVALKMAFKATARRYNLSLNEPFDVLGIYGCNHGDTITGCPKNVYNELGQWYKPKIYWLRPPSVHISQGRAYIRLPPLISNFLRGKPNRVYYDSINDIYNVGKKGKLRDIDLAGAYLNYIRAELVNLKYEGRRFGAVLMEPVLMGAGGMIFVDPLFQHCLIDMVRKEASRILYGMREDKLNFPKEWQGLPIIFDEVFSGWYRLGCRSPSEFLGMTPDIVAYAKTLTGGLVPLALTVTKESIYVDFLADKTSKCLLHGHSYTAHAVGCAVALTSIEKMDEMADDTLGSWVTFRKQWKFRHVWSMWSPMVVEVLSKLSNVESVMTMGSVLAVELKKVDVAGKDSSVSKSLIQMLSNGKFTNEVVGTSLSLFVRPLGDMVYLIASQTSTREDLHQCELVLTASLKSCLHL